MIAEARQRTEAKPNPVRVRSELIWFGPISGHCFPEPKVRSEPIEFGPNSIYTVPPLSFSPSSKKIRPRIWNPKQLTLIIQELQILKQKYTERYNPRIITHDEVHASRPMRDPSFGCALHIPRIEMKVRRRVLRVPPRRPRSHPRPLLRPPW